MCSRRERESWPCLKNGTALLPPRVCAVYSSLFKCLSSRETDCLFAKWAPLRNCWLTRRLRFEGHEAMTRLSPEASPRLQQLRGVGDDLLVQIAAGFASIDWRWKTVWTVGTKPNFLGAWFSLFGASIPVSRKDVSTSWPPFGSWWRRELFVGRALASLAWGLGVMGRRVRVGEGREGGWGEGGESCVGDFCSFVILDSLLHEIKCCWTQEHASERRVPSRHHVASSAADTVSVSVLGQTNCDDDKNAATARPASSCDWQSPSSARWRVVRPAKANNRRDG